MALVAGGYLAVWPIPKASAAWTVDVYQDLMVQDYGLPEVLPKVGSLAAFATAFFGLGVGRFRFEMNG